MQRRQRQRLVTDLNAVCRNPGTPYVVTVSNILKSGCKLSSSDLRRGETVLLNLPVGEVAGQVIWAGWGECGVKFSREIDDDFVASVALSTTGQVEAPFRKMPLAAAQVSRL